MGKRRTTSPKKAVFSTTWEYAKEQSHNGSQETSPVLLNRNGQRSPASHEVLRMALICLARAEGEAPQEAAKGLHDSPTLGLLIYGPGSAHTPPQQAWQSLLSFPKQQTASQSPGLKALPADSNKPCGRSLPFQPTGSGDGRRGSFVSFPSNLPNAG